MLLGFNLRIPCGLPQAIIHSVKVYTEAANFPTTLKTDEVLKEKDLYVIPDFFCNAGGVTIYYFEEVQNNMNYY